MEVNITGNDVVKVGGDGQHVCTHRLAVIEVVSVITHI